MLKTLKSCVSICYFIGWIVKIVLCLHFFYIKDSRWRCVVVVEKKRMSCVKKEPECNSIELSLLWKYGLTELEKSSIIDVWFLKITQFIES